MSVFDVLVAVFTADTTGIKKGSKEAIKAIDDVEKKTKATKSSVDVLGESLIKAAKSFGNALAAAVSVGAVIASLRSAASETKVLSDLAQQTGDSVEKIDAWSSAVREAGGDAGQFQSTLISMNNALQDIQFNPKNASIPYFRWLGVNIRNSRGEVKSFLELLPDLATAFESLTPKQANMLGRKIGLDQSTILLLQKGRREVDAIIAEQKELGVVTKIDTEIVNKFNKQWERTTHAFRSLAVWGNSELLPLFTKILKSLEKTTKFFKEHKDVIIGGLIAIAGVITYTLIPALLRMEKAWLRALGPIGLLVVGIALAYDDIKTFLEGGNSLIGDAIKKWPILGDIFKFIGNEVQQTIKHLVPFVNFLKMAGLDAIELGKLIINWTVSAFKQLAQWIDAVVARYEKFKNFVTGGAQEEPVNNISLEDYKKSDRGIAAQKLSAPQEPVNNASLEGYKKFDRGMSVQKLIESVEIGKRAITLASTSPISAQTSNSILNTGGNSSSRSVDVRTGDINIQTQATDSQAIALSINESLQNVIRGATGNFNDGVAA